MNNAIGDKLATEWQAIRHPGHHANPQETRMTRISDAKAAIDRAAEQLASIGSNQLAEAIADAGVGKTLTPGDVGLVLAVIRAIEHGPGLATPAQAAQQTTGLVVDAQGAQQTPAQQLQPQQTA